MIYFVVVINLFGCIFRAVFFTFLHFLYDFKFHKRYYKVEVADFKEMLNQLKKS